MHKWLMYIIAIIAIYYVWKRYKAFTKWRASNKNKVIAIDERLKLMLWKA